MGDLKQRDAYSVKRQATIWRVHLILQHTQPHRKSLPLLSQVRELRLRGELEEGVVQHLTQNPLIMGSTNIIMFLAGLHISPH